MMPVLSAGVVGTPLAVHHLAICVAQWKRKGRAEAKHVLTPRRKRSDERILFVDFKYNHTILYATKRRRSPSYYLLRDPL